MLTCKDEHAQDTHTSAQHALQSAKEPIMNESSNTWQEAFALAEADVIDLAAAKIRRGDHIVRGTAADGQLRAFAITAKNSVEELRRRHSSSPVVTAGLGRLMMAGMMMGAMNKGEDELITLTMQGDGPAGRYTVTANNHGQAKGYANHPHVWLPLNGKGKLDVGGSIGQGTLSVVHDFPGADPYSSEVPLVTGEVGDDLAYYFALSDQIPTSLGVGVLVDTDTSVRQAGGFIVQAMPGWEPAVRDHLEANLKDVTSVTDLLEAGMSPTDILAHVLDGLGYQELDVMPAEFHCGCTRERAARAVTALGRSELEDMIEKEEPADVFCHFCGAHYQFQPEELQKMLG